MKIYESIFFGMLEEPYFQDINFVKIRALDWEKSWVKITSMCTNLHQSLTRVQGNLFEHGTSNFNENLRVNTHFKAYESLFNPMENNSENKLANERK